MAVRGDERQYLQTDDAHSMYALLEAVREMSLAQDMDESDRDAHDADEAED